MAISELNLSVLEKAQNLLLTKPGYLKKSNQKIAERLKIYPVSNDILQEIATAKRNVKDLRNKLQNPEFPTRLENTKELKKKFEVPVQHYMDDIRNLYPIELYNRRVLVIGDLHAPFIRKGYLEHCIKVKAQYNCDTIVFIGDVIDNHYSSYHETDPNGLGGATELELAIEMLKPWYQAFPNAYIMIGNHDRLIMRKAQSSDVPRQWIRTYSEVLQTPGWIFTESIDIDNVNYNHGEGGTARNKAKNNLESTVQGHIHTQAYIEFFVGKKSKIFGMQVGCGVDDTAYAMAYGKHFKKQAISCGTVINGRPYLELMDL